MDCYLKQKGEGLRSGLENPPDNGLWNMAFPRNKVVVFASLQTLGKDSPYAMWAEEELNFFYRNLNGLDKVKPKQNFPFILDKQPACPYKGESQDSIIRLIKGMDFLIILLKSALSLFPF